MGCLVNGGVVAIDQWLDRRNNFLIGIFEALFGQFTKRLDLPRRVIGPQRSECIRFLSFSQRSFGFGLGFGRSHRSFLGLSFSLGFDRINFLL